MKQIRYFFSFLTLLFIVNNFSAQTADITEGCAPLQVNFEAPNGYSTWYWDFKDGATSPLEDPSNTFLNPGTYVVEFSELVSGPIVGTITITVYAKPVIDISLTSPTQGCTGLTVNFEDNTTLPGGVIVTGYNWTFGDGGSGNTSPVSNTYSVAGVYDISLEILTNLISCNSTAIFNDVVSVTEPPVTEFITSPDPAQACSPPLIVSFANISTSTTLLTYSWDFGNGNNSTDQSPSPETYSSNGNFPVSLTATDTNGCAFTFSTTVSIGQPTTSFVIPDTVCLNTDVFPVNNSSSGNYLWTFGPNASPALSGQAQPTVQFTSTGLQTVSLVTSSATGFCSDTLITQVFVEDPQVTFTSSPSYFCYEPATINYTGVSSSNIVSWDWEFGDGSTGTGQSISHEYVIGDTTYSEHGENIISTTLTVTTASGCIAEFTDVDTIFLPWARFMPDVVNGCAPLTVTFSDSSRSNDTIVQWEWNYGDGNTLTSTNNNPNTNIFTIPGVYDVTLIITNNLGCTDTSDTIRIEVGDLVALDFAADLLSVCPGETIQFTNLTTDSALVDAWHYYSEEDRQFHCYQDYDPTWAYNNVTGFQDVTLAAEYNGCWSTVTKPNYIEVKGPIAKFNYRQDCSTTMDVLFSDSSSSTTSISWDFGDGNNSTASTVPYTYAATGDYNVVLTASNSTSGCPDSKDSAIVHIRTIVANFTTDTLLCGGISYDYDASPSTDVNQYCNRGYTWIFSDPSLRPLTGSSPTESITFNTSGSQTIGLVVEDINGCVDTLIENIRVFNSTASFSVNDTIICIPDTLNFIDLTEPLNADTTITTWAWDFGDGNTSSTQNPTNIYSAPVGATIPVSLTVTDILGCEANTQLLLTTYEPISYIGIIPSPANVCVNDSIDFVGTDFNSQGSSLSFSWDFDDGGSSNLQNDSYAYAASGSYNVVLTYTENSSGCSGTANVSVNVQDYPDAGYFSSVDTLTALCNPQTVVFMDSSNSTSAIITYQWDFGTGNLIYGDTVSTIFTSGVHDIELIVSTSYGCSDTAISQLTVVGPEGNFTFDNNNICKGDAITFTLIDTVDVDSYSWDFGDGISENDVSPVNHLYNFLPPSGQTVAKLTVFGPNGACPVVIDTIIYIHEVRADFFRNDEIDTVLCLGESLTLTDNSLLSDIYLWTLGDGGTSTSSTNFDYTYTAADTFDITLYVESSAFGCKDTIIKQVIVSQGPVFTPVGDTVCPSETAIVEAGNVNTSYTYLWEPNADVTDPSSESTSTIALTESQYFNVTVTNLTTGCSAIDSAFVYVYPIVTGYTFDTVVVVGDTVVLPIDNLNGTLIFTWEPEDGLSCLQCSNPYIAPALEDMTYYLTAADVFGCYNPSYIFNIEVIPETLIEVPTTFTPNGDGINDIIYVESWGVKEFYEFQIFNRWGELIFETNDINVGWNGYYNGVLQNNDIYVFKARALDWFDKEIYKEGHIHLMR